VETRLSAWRVCFLRWGKLDRCLFCNPIAALTHGIFFIQGASAGGLLFWLQFIWSDSRLANPAATHR
jgi:hypothetical protein